MKAGRPVAALFLLTTVGGCAAPPVEPPTLQTVVRLTTGTPGGGFYRFGEDLAAAYETSLPALRIRTIPSPGAVTNVEAIQRGDAEFGFTFADLAYVAYNTGLGDRRGRFDRLRAMAVMQLTPVHFVVGAQSGIAGIADLRGRRVSVGMPGTGTALTVELVLSMYGISVSDVRIESMPFDEAARRIADGTLDAMFDAAIYPVDAVKVATRGGGRLLPLAGREMDRLRREYPFFSPAVIPRHSYPGLSEAVLTIGVDSVLVCRRDLDEGLVYDLTEHFFEALPSLSSSLDALRLMDLDQSPATPIPLHPGAARFYRERELVR